MDRVNLPEIVCQFCQRKLEIPADYNLTYECECGAVYWVVSQDDLYMAEDEGAETLGLRTDLIEIRIIKKFDILTDFEGQDPETGDFQALVFARAHEPWYGLYKLALEKMPQASTHKRNAFVRAVGALTGDLPLGTAGFGPTVREYAAIRQYGQQRHTLETAMEVLIREDGLMFGPITDLHRKCWTEDFQFNGNDPQDVAELEGSTGKP